MVKPTALQATIAHTQLGAAWLWNSRGCRVIADEVGFSAQGVSMFCEPQMANWRADLAGVSWDQPPGVWRYDGGWPVFDLIEVKGHRADWLRERPLNPRSKWRTSESSTCRLWLLVASTIDDAALANLPEWWGILRADAAVEKLTVVRKPPQSGRIAEPALAARSLYAVAQRSVVRQLPTMRYARDERGRLVQGTLRASLLALRAPGAHWLGQNTHEISTTQNPHNEATAPSDCGL